MRIFKPQFMIAASDGPVYAGDKLGGLACGVALAEWPSCSDCGKPMSFIAQFHHDDDRLDLGGPERVLTLWQCEHAPGMCDTWEQQSGANAALVVPVADGQRTIPAPDSSVVVYHELVTTGWSDEDDGVPLDRCPAYFDDAQHSELGDEWWGRGGYGTRLGGVPAWIQSPDEAPGPPWQFIGQVAEGHRVDDEPRPGQLPGIGIQRYVDGEYRLEPPPRTEGEGLKGWVIVDETGCHVPGTNFGGGGIAYVFLDRSVDPPAGLLFWQC